MERKPIVEMKNIVKVYSDGTVALRGVDFSLYPGEVHGLLGENGAGKTTLMRILYGEIRPTKGEIFVEGRKVSFRSPKDAIMNGIGMVYQHFTLVPPMTALENIILGFEPVAGGFINFEKARKEVEGIMKSIGLEVPLDVPIENLGVGERQRVEIIKLLYRKVKILILDEPTSVLSPVEVENLFEAIRKLKEQGKTIVFITHKIKEVFKICDRVTVLRRGKNVGTFKVSEVDAKTLARLMVGREMKLEIEKPPAKKVGKPVLQVKDLWVKGDKGVYAVRGVTFEVRAGEIFGIAGVEGNGQEELVEAITGLRPVDKGKVIINGVDATNKGSRFVRDLGVAHIPSDRHKRGLVLDASVKANMILGRHYKEPLAKKLFDNVRYLDFRQISKFVDEMIKKFEIVTPGPYAPVRSLSGGNQQKVVVARELATTPVLIVASQPTRGLDIASTLFVHRILLAMREQGCAILLVSSDLDEVLALSDRVAVIYEGRFMGIGKPEEFTLEEIGLMMGGMTLEEIRAKR